MKNITIQKSLVIGLMSTMLAIPFMVSAESNGKGNNKNIEKKEAKQERENRESCTKAYGHLVAPGWIKNNAEVSVSEHCFLPFGIAKKFGTRGTTTPDTTAPVISNISTSAEATEAIISWTTDENTTGTVFLSASSTVDINAASTLRKGTDVRGKTHFVRFLSLTPSTTYYAMVRAKDVAGNVATSSVVSFTTKAPVVIPDVTAPTISSVVAVVGTSSVKVGWMTNEPATSKLYYSTTSPVNTSTSSVNFMESTSLSLSHLLEAVNLALHQTYYFVVQSKDAAGNTQSTSEFQVSTQ